VRILLSIATALVILAVAFVIVLTPLWTHFALNASGSIATGAFAGLSDQTVGQLVFGGDFRLTAGPQFTADEVAHMRDARTVLYGFLAASAVAAAFAAFIVSRSPRDPSRWAAVARGGIGLAIGILIVGPIAFLAFDAAFTLFHEIFFPGGNWSFPADSLLIRIYPEAFFEMTALAIGALAVLGGVVVWFVARRRANAVSAA
jgi:integral membrane protein (TIGR01906 family)